MNGKIMNKQLVPLHVHSHYSLLDSLIKPEDYVKWGVENNMPALALTDHGVLSGSIQFYKECKKNNIKPILGLEAYLTLDEPDAEEKHKDNYHIILLAKNKAGWLNLIKLHNASYNNFYHKPRITYNDLEKYSEGIICCSACLGGHLSRLIIDKNIENLKKYTMLYKKIFGDDFYIELQDHNLEIQKPVNKVLVKIAKALKIKLIATNDSHYTNATDAFAHQVLLCKQTQKKISDEKKMNFGSSEFYLKNTKEMSEQLSYLGAEILEEIYANSAEICNKVEEYDILQHEYNYPTFGDKKESIQKLTELVKAGFKKRFAGKPIDNKKYLTRLQYELESIYNIGFTDYFILLYDLYAFCEKENIYTGLGRGSGAGSLILYCLNVTGLDPIEYNLLFERFINPERISAPDVDCDVDDKDRQKVVRYIEDKYGLDKVCNIATYGNLTSVSAFKAVANVLEMPFVEANRISKDLLDTNLSLDENLENNEELKLLYNTDTLLRKIIDTAKVLEGGKEKRGIHAAGVVIANQNLENLTPIMKIKDTSGNNVNVSCFEMSEIDGDLKLLKLDILGLKNLSITKEAIRRIGKDIDFKKLEFNDDKTFKMLQMGETLGVFQLESDIMKHLCKQVKPISLEDISVINAGARPGALESGLMSSFIDRKNGNEDIDYVVDGMEKYLGDTLGLPIFQENIMQLSQVMAGYTMPEADNLRKIIGKKLLEKFDAEREKFVNGCIQNGHTEERAKEIFDMIEKFGRYGFNKSHSMAYSALSYVTAYLKANYPCEYMTSLLNANSDNNDKLSKYIDESYRLGIDIRCPDINKSDMLFEHDIETNSIVFGFNGIKGIGDAYINPLLLERENGFFKSFKDIITRIPSISKKVLECLIRSGALNSIEKYPYKYLNLLEYTTKVKQKSSYKKGNLSLYDGILELYSIDLLQKNKEYVKLEAEYKSIKGAKKDDKLRKEELSEQMKELIDIEINKFNEVKLVPSLKKLKDDEQELIGFAISVNPKKSLIKFSENINYISLKKLKDSKDYESDFVTMLTVKKVSKTKNGAYFLVLADDTDEIMTFISKDRYNENKDKITTGSIFRIYCKLGQSNNDRYPDNLKIEYIRYFNVGVNNDSLISLNSKLDNKQLAQALLKIKNDSILEERDINYRLQINNNHDKIKTNIDFWIDKLDSISEIMIKYNITIGENDE